VNIEVDDRSLAADVAAPARSIGAVVFAHGSGSSRRSPRNLLVAGRLNEAGLLTLLFDLLSPEEGEDRSRVFDIPLLASRLLAATRWLCEQPEASGLAVGYFGASTGAAAALEAAARLGEEISAVVARGGRPDLASEVLADVVAPTLLIVGSLDHAVLEMNRSAQERLRCESMLEIVPGATHLFEEPGTLEKVADLAAEWFVGHLAAGVHRA